LDNSLGSYEDNLYMVVGPEEFAVLLDALLDT
jgi:hypothetical protein